MISENIMAAKSIKNIVQDLLKNADVTIDGNRPWDIQVNNEGFYSRILSDGSLALGESYMDGWWECNAIDQLIDRIIRANLHKKITSTREIIWSLIKTRLMNQQRLSKAFEIGKHHYDIGNDLFINMLDKRMNYSSAYWKNVRTLDDAQEAKLDLTCKKLKLSKGMRVLDIGCGWGSFAIYAAEKFRVSVVGITISKEQVSLVSELHNRLDIEIKLMDYRDLNDKFDRIVSIGMFEHVGHKNHRRFFEVVNRCLNEDGIFLLHTIGGNTSATTTDPWINKYIFPNSLIPSAHQITKASEGLLKLEDWHNFGADYDKTLMSWYANFHKNWQTIKPSYSDRFYRMWKYYLLSCAGSFRAQHNRLWQIVFSKLASQIYYDSVR